MKFYTPKELENGEAIESDKYYLFLNFQGTPYEAFSVVPFLSNSQAGKLSEFEAAVCSFEDEIIAQNSLNKIREKKQQENLNITASLINNGILIDSVD